MSVIYAFVTPGIVSAIGIIRFSGNGIEDLFKNILRKKCLVEKELRYSRLYHYDDIIDSGMYYFKKGPDTVTGEDYGELHLHGSPVIYKKLCKVLNEAPGVIQAQKGDFTKRSFLNGKQDLTQSESVHDLIQSKTDYQRKLSLQYLDGAVSGEVKNYVDKIYSILSKIEMQLDFSDEEIPVEVIKSIENDIDICQKSIARRTNTKETFEKIGEGGLKVAIIGAPNVGKSSFINKLTGKNQSIVTDIPGTTRDVIEISLDINGFPVTILDTAGLRKTDCVIEREGIRRAVEASYHADLVLHLQDAKTFLEQNEKMFHVEHFYENLKESEDLRVNILPKRFKKIVSKIDLLNKQGVDLLKKCSTWNISSSQTNGLQEADKHIENILTFSIYNDHALDEIVLFLQNYFIEKFQINLEEPLLKKRYKDCYKKALSQLSIAKKYLVCKNYTLLSQALRNAVSEMEVITGKFAPDEVLNNIFSNFCIGK